MPYPLIKPYNPNIVKKYVIDNSMLGSKDIDTLFENVVPTEMLDFRKMSKRLAFAHFIKSNLIKENGDYIKLHGTGNTLLSNVKPIDINPQYYGDLKNTNNMVLYQSCYPIQLDKRYNDIQCSSNSAGINLRVYDYENYDRRLNDKETDLKNTLKNIRGDYHEMLKKINEIKNNTKGNNNVDKEIFINEHIKENILKKNICPHFCMYYGYNFTKGNIRDPNNPNKNSLYKNIVFTEGPNYNLKNWAIPEFVDDGLVKSAKKQGVYSKHLWDVAIFQILTLFLVKQIDENVKKLKIDMSNLYVKNIKKGGYWKYVINGIDLYVPNYGFIILYQSNFQNEDIKGTEDKINDQLGILIGELKTITEIPQDNKDELDELKEGDDLFDNILNKTKIFHNFIHNKIGKSVAFFKKDEMKITEEVKDLKVGDIIGYGDKNNEKYALVIENGSNIKIILDKKENKTEDIDPTKIKNNKDDKGTVVEKGKGIFIFNSIDQGFNENKISFSKNNKLDTFKIDLGKIISGSDGEDKGDGINNDFFGGSNSDEIVYDSESDNIIL